MRNEMTIEWSDGLYDTDDYVVDVELCERDEDGEPLLELANTIYVDGVPYNDYYIVFNKNTGVIEHKCPQLAEAKSAAAGFQYALEKQPWAMYEKLEAALKAVEEGEEGGGSAPPTLLQ